MIHIRNQYLDNLNDPSFQGMNDIFVLLFKNNNNRTGHAGGFF